jgi:hypothetical protein
MDIEVVEFYPNRTCFRKGCMFGTMHIYIIDTEQDIRGVKVFKKDKCYFFKMPYFIGYDEETKENVTYPMFSFTDVEKNKALMDAIVQRGTAYIKTMIKDCK